MLFKLTVNVEVHNSLDIEKRKEVRGVFPSIEAARMEARREIIRMSAEDNTDAELKNHLLGRLTFNVGIVFKYESKDTIKFKEVYHYWVESVHPTNELVKAACDLYEDKCVEREYPELNALLLKFISDKIEK